MRYFSAALADSRRPRLVEAVWLRREVTQNDWSPLMRSMLAMTMYAVQSPCADASMYSAIGSSKLVIGGNVFYPCLGDCSVFFGLFYANKVEAFE